jgi:hypothetical protein
MESHPDVTRRLQDAPMLLDIRVPDHVLGKNGHFFTVSDPGPPPKSHPLALRSPGGAGIKSGPGEGT